MSNCDTFMFIGSYTQKMGHTSGLGKGISIFKFNTTTGKPEYIKTISTSQCGESPAAFHIDNKTNTIYICNESAATMTQLTFDPNNNFKVTSTKQLPSNGPLPCYISQGSNGYIYLSNFGDVSKLNPSNTESTSIVAYRPRYGRKGPFNETVKHVNEKGSGFIAHRQQRAHIHCIIPCRRGTAEEEVYCTDFGRDGIYHYKLYNIGAWGVSSRYDPPPISWHVKSSIKSSEPGDAPRHFCYNPRVEGMYVYNVYDTDFYGL